MDLIDQAGAEVYADFHFYYQLDLFDLVAGLVEGRITPALLLALVERMPQGNMTQARMVAGDDWRRVFGWGVTDQVLSEVFDAINVNSNITRNVEKPIKFEPYPTPAIFLAKREKQKERRTLDGLYAWLGGVAPEEE